MSRLRPALALGHAAVAVTLLAACSSSDGGGAATSGREPEGGASTPAAAASGKAGADPSRASTPTSTPTSAPSSTPTSTPTSAPAPGLPRLGPQREQTDVLDRLPGTADSACVEVGTDRDVRSGSFAAGPFDTARSEAGSGTVRLYFIPEHSKTMPGVLVTGRNASTGATFERRERTVVDADQFRLYDLQLPAGPGTWQIRAVAGRDRGCWSVDLG